MATSTNNSKSNDPKKDQNNAAKKGANGKSTDSKKDQTKSSRRN